MSLGNVYYDGFEDKWRDRLEDAVAASGIDSLLIMRSTLTHMVAAVSAGPRRDTYHPGDAGPKCVNPGCPQALLRAGGQRRVVAADRRRARSAAVTPGIPGTTAGARLVRATRAKHREEPWH